MQNPGILFSPPLESWASPSPVPPSPPLAELCHSSLVKLLEWAFLGAAVLLAALQASLALLAVSSSNSRRPGAYAAWLEHCSLGLADLLVRLLSRSQHLKNRLIPPILFYCIYSYLYSMFSHFLRAGLRCVVPRRPAASTRLLRGPPGRSSRVLLPIRAPRHRHTSKSRCASADVELRVRRLFLIE